MIAGWKPIRETHWLVATPRFSVARILSGNYLRFIRAGLHYLS